MQLKHNKIWVNTIQFLSTFKSLSYNEIPLNLLLFRDFQKLVQKYFKHFPIKKLKKSHIKTTIQKSCQPYLIESVPKYSNKGYTLIRADLYPLTIDVKNHKFIYLAHHYKEYRKMKQTMIKIRKLHTLFNKYPICNLHSRNL